MRLATCRTIPCTCHRIFRKGSINLIRRAGATMPASPVCIADYNSSLCLNLKWWCTLNKHHKADITWKMLELQAVRYQNTQLFDVMRRTLPAVKKLERKCQQGLRALHNTHTMHADGWHSVTTRLLSADPTGWCICRTSSACTLFKRTHCWWGPSAAHDIHNNAS
jgi:hypothetical protein